MSQSGPLNNDSGTIPSNVPIDFITDSGTAEAINNEILVKGALGLSTSGTGNVITISGAVTATTSIARTFLLMGG